MNIIQRINHNKANKKYRESHKEEIRGMMYYQNYEQANKRDFGGLKTLILQRDNYSCVRCGMTDADHEIKYGRGISVDHIDKNRKHNTMDNLQTLCLPCHLKKDKAEYRKYFPTPCKFCSNIFIPKNKKQLFCSLSCNMNNLWSTNRNWRKSKATKEELIEVLKNA